MKKLLIRLDNFLERKWRETSTFLLYLADKRVEEEDIDWLNMNDNYIKSKKDKD